MVLSGCGKQESILGKKYGVRERNLYRMSLLLLTAGLITLAASILFLAAGLILKIPTLYLFFVLSILFSVVNFFLSSLYRRKFKKLIQGDLAAEEIITRSAKRSMKQRMLLRYAIIQFIICIFIIVAMPKPLGFIIGGLIFLLGLFLSFLYLRVRKVVS